MGKRPDDDGLRLLETHGDGSNLIFLDGHAKWVPGNPEGQPYLAKDENGCFYQKFFTIDR